MATKEKVRLHLLDALRGFLLLHMIRSHAGEISVGRLPLIVTVVVGKHRHVAKLCLLNGLNTVAGQEVYGVHNVSISRHQPIHKIVIQIIGDILQEEHTDKAKENTLVSGAWTDLMRKYGLIP